MRILSARAMREVDRRAIEEIGIPSLVLMENAAVGVADALGERYPEARSVAIFCGPGNNGGDGLALGRLLDGRGYEVALALVTGGRNPSGDAAVQLAICRRQGLAVAEPGDDAGLDAALRHATGCDVVVDALFGTGLERPLGEPFAGLVGRLNALGRPIVAVDLPSGLDASRPVPIGPHVRADLTVTFAAPKIAQVFAPASGACGDLAVAELGIPPALLEEAEGGLHWLDGADLAGYLTPRPADAHKGTYGHVLIVAGGRGKAGAAVLAARAAVRGGAGLVTAAVPEPIQAIVHGGSLESMTVALPVDLDDLAPAAFDAVRAAWDGKTCVAMGPGLGQGTGTRAVVERLVRECPLPMVVDADALNAFAGRIAGLAERRSEAILTPHPGELARLLGASAADVQADRLGAVRRAAEASRAVVVLKGHASLIATPEGEVWVNATGNPGMASGGMGDVLTGLLGALLAQGLQPLAAAQLGVHLHGLAGDLASERLGPVGIRAGDLVDLLPVALRQLTAC